MPLLRKKVFEKQTVPDFLRDDEEVFYCEITNEIFRDYHDFSERMFLCNSMVWTCSMTGKSNLTYQEAVESEEHARQCLKEFPTELKLPILYLATLTKRTFFGEMADDIFSYAKDRFFVGENVEACFTSNKWKDCHVISVIAPDETQYKNEIMESCKRSPSDRNFVPSPSLYKYEIEHLDADDNDICEIMIVDSTQLRRKKGVFSRDKSKLFLKQHVEQDSRGIFVIKSTDLEKYNVHSVLWETIFDGPPPNFQSSKNFEKAVNGKKRQKQETLSKYLEKNGLVMKKEGQANKEKKNNLLEQMKKREEEFKKLKQINDEQKALDRQKKKEESMKMAQYFKEWSSTKEDLELEDHVKLPIPIPVKSRVPEKYFGSLLEILEFVHSFPKLLSTKDFFPGGFSLEILERALIEKEVAGPLTDLIQMLLVAVFNCQEEESNNYNTGVETLKETTKDKLSTTPSVEEAIRRATFASKWPIKYQGLPLNRLPLYPLTVSEILRLHLLSSGAKIKESGASWRYGLRGGYTNEDDPGLYMRLNQAHVLKALAIHNIVQLSIRDKLKTISCLMNQILTYADVRDTIEDRLVKVRQAKLDLKAARVADRKREMEYVSQKFKLKKEMKEDAAGLQAALDALEIDNEKKQATNQKKIEKLVKASSEGQTLLGRDRAYRKYLKIESVPAIFVNWEDEHVGTCLEKAAVQYPELANADRSELMAHIKKLHDPPNNSKENSPSKSPSKSPKRTNGIRKSLSSIDIDVCNELLLCSADPTNCPVHKEKSDRPRWSFFYEKEQVDELIKALNNRGYRESNLKEALKNEENKLTGFFYWTPVSLLNSDIDIKPEISEENSLRANGNSKKKDRYEDANLGYPPDMKSEKVLENALIENILEMEEKISGGALGTLKVKDRDKWRNCLQNKDYSEFGKIDSIAVNHKENKRLRVKKSEKERSRSSTPEIPDKDKKEEEYKDPGKFLGPTLDIESEDSEDDKDSIVLLQSEEIQTAIRCLAIALCQIAQAVDLKHLKRPLGHADVRPSNKHKDKYDVLEKWEQSLLASTSFSQLFLHYGTLDSCVMWSRSALLARCQICRRQKDSENMLLCDSCNLGHHMYCLKPKLTAVPKGDWFCEKCKKEKEKQEKLLSPEPVKKRRRIFVEEEVDEEEEQDSGNEEGGDEEQSSEAGETSEDDDDNDAEGDIKLELCKTCGSGGEVVSCEKCLLNFHKECITPPLRRLPRSPWTCPSCSSKDKKDRSREKVKENGYDSDDGSGAVKSSGVTYSQRRCAAKANRKIHSFTKALRIDNSKIYSSDDDDSDSDEVVQKRSLRRDEKREDLPLNNAALQELLSDVMKHEAAWPFLRPVQLREVPDYFEVISEPMDFGTIKYKLNMGKYSTDSQLMRDVVLVFENCNTYNSSTDEVYQLGVDLQSYLSKKAKELGLTVPPELEDEKDNPRPKSKKRRTK